MRIDNNRICLAQAFVFPAGIPVQVPRQNKITPVRRVDMQAEACVVCHDRSEPLRSVPASSRVRIYRSPGGGRVLGLVSSINNQAECSSAPCHAHSPTQTVLGVLDVMMSLEGADEQLADMRRQTVLWTLLMVAMMVLVVIVGTALDFTPTVLILTPVLMPLVKQAGIDPIYFGVLFIINNAIGLLTPPVGIVLNVVCGVARVSMSDVIRGVNPFLVAQISVLFLLIVFPQLVMWPFRAFMGLPFQW